MAFHVACPITCRRICFCPLGFSRDLQSGDSKAEFLLDVSRIEEFVKDPLGIRVSNGATVQVSVPKILPPQTLVFAGDGGGGGGGGGGGAGEVEDAASAQAKRVALQKKAAYAMVAAEDYARRFESGDNAVISSKDAGEEQGVANGNLMCRICFMGEVDGTERARRMLSCKSCGKKYHRNCLKVWAQHRDLFHWSSWACPSCRICEICQRTGDPTKFMFCKRCDGAYHCYCQHPPHKNVSSGPYLCTKHRRCHSCGSNVPGNGLSVRWFLGYTCCDACGRLFVKGNYCPVCLKVYRDSESTPMVCCDICQRWVHCQCDGISDEKYLQFQVDGNLQYKCATCRGECYQVKDLEDAVQELWRRRDKADQDLIASLRAAAGLPTQEDIFSISPYSDDEENAPPMLKNEMRRSFKLSLKGLADKPPKSNHYGKKYAKKIGKRKGSQVSHISKIGVYNDNLYENSLENSKYDETEDMKQGQDADESPVAGMMNQYSGVSSINQSGGLKHKFVDEVMIPREEKTSRVIKIKSSRHEPESGDDTEKHSDKLKSTKAKKLVINLGPRKINVASSPRSDASSGQREHVLTTSNGSGDSENQTIRKRFKGERHQESAKFSDGDMVNGLGPPKGLKFAGREGNVIKFGKVKYEAPNSNSQVNGGFDVDKQERVPTHGTRILLGKRGSEGSRAAVGLTNELPRSSPKKPMIDGRPDTEGNDDSNDTPILQSLAKDSRFSLKLKIKKPNPENQDSQSTPQMEEKTYVRGQRSKRKRSSVFMEKTPPNEDGDAAQACQDSEMMEANWILKKLGKDAIGKRVEVHQVSDNSWHRGVVSDINDNKSMLSVSLDDGRVRSLELGKQAVRFVSQKERRT